MRERYGRLKFACYTTNLTMSIIGNLPPMLFLTFRSLYDISYSLLGLLVLANFATQLTVDLILSFFSHKFSLPKLVKMTPAVYVLGLMIFMLAPVLFPGNVYLGLVIGTVIFSAAGGLNEVLISPMFAAIPAENPEREMSKLHSVYAWGVVGVIIFGTLFLFAFGKECWQWLVAALLVIPVSSVFAFMGAQIPEMETQEKVSGVLTLLKKKELWLCVFAIFLGGASECTMAQWSSGYLEQALGIDKVWGDIFGVALFGATLGLGRSLYAKIGKNIGRVLFLGAIGATVCYLLCAVCGIPAVGLVACAFTGFCVSMMWPGCLVVAADRVPTGGVFIYAMMASGGDLGAALGPQLIGLVTDTVIANPFASALAQNWGLMPDQLGLKLGMLVGMLFPLVGIAVYGLILRTQKKTVNT